MFNRLLKPIAHTVDQPLMFTAAIGELFEPVFDFRKEVVDGPDNLLQFCQTVLWLRCLDNLSKGHHRVTPGLRLQSLLKVNGRHVRCPAFQYKIKGLIG